ncbi:hypothetical protein CTI14_66185, partial [Methylobacterium radiotolerans]
FGVPYLLNSPTRLRTVEREGAGVVVRERNDVTDYPEYRETVTVHHTEGSAELTFGVPYLLNSPTRLRTVEREGAGVVVRERNDVT